MDNSQDKTYTPTEVGTLVESFRNDLSVIAERVGSLVEDVGQLKDAMREVKSDITVIKDVIRIEIPSIHRRLDRVETKVFG